MCFKEREKPAKIVVFLSVLVILCGVVMFIESVVYQSTGNNIFTADLGTWTENVAKFKNVTGGFLIAFSLVAFFTGIGGASCNCGPCAKGNICYPIIYGILIMFVWIVVLVIGIVLTAVSFAGPE